MQPHVTDDENLDLVRECHMLVGAEHDVPVDQFRVPVVHAERLEAGIADRPAVAA